MDSPAEVEKALSSLLACQFPFPAVAAHELPVQPSGRSVCALCNGHLQAALPTHKKVRLPLELGRCAGFYLPSASPLRVHVQEMAYRVDAEEMCRCELAAAVRCRPIAVAPSSSIGRQATPRLFRILHAN